MKKYLSFGGGVNSTALLLLLTEQNIEFETIFVNHGGDYPETYEYIEYLCDQGFEITEVLPNVAGGYTSLYDYCGDRRIIPFRGVRWCSEMFKVRPFLNYIASPCVCYLGFDKGEEPRAIRRKSKSDKESNITYAYPLIDAEMNRDDCRDSIKKHGLKVPPKSGCFFCPFMKRSDIRILYLNHHALYEKAKALELNCRARNPNRFIRDRPFEDNAMEDVPPLSSYDGKKSHLKYGEW